MFSKLSKIAALSTILFSLAMPAMTQERTLVQVGDFSRTFGSAIYDNDESYQVFCDQFTGWCDDSAGNLWAFGTNLSGIINICEETEDTGGPAPCVHVVEINLTTTEPYVDVFVSIQRAGCEANEIVYDNNKAGGVSSSGSFIGGTAVEESHFVDVGFSLGMVTPRKTHTLLISSPSGAAAAGCTQGINAITGIEIFGTPISEQP